ncbi:MAG: hypothetical protein ACYCYO_02145 [Bacilli bacterium]
MRGRPITPDELKTMTDSTLFLKWKDDRILELTDRVTDLRRVLVEMEIEIERLRGVARAARKLHETVNSFHLDACDLETVIRARSLLADRLLATDLAPAVHTSGAAVPAPAGEERTCLVCGCTDDHACEGGCFWVAHDLCSACMVPLNLADLIG